MNMRELVIQALMDQLSSGLAEDKRAAFLADYNNMSDKDLLERLLMLERLDAITYQNL